MKHPKVPILVTAALALGVLVLAPTAATAAVDPALAGGCPTADEGVTVVVDFTDVGGGVEVGCADGDPTSGREALELAGFTPENATSGLICTVDGLPDPCPTEFDGSFWSYWSAEPGADWVSYQVGPDEADPVVGSFEGWRYFDGSAGPSVAASDVAAAAGADGPASDAESTQAQTSEQEAAGSDAESADAEAEEQGSGAPIGLIAGIAGVAIVAIVTVLVARRRRTQQED